MAYTEIGSCSPGCPAPDLEPVHFCVLPGQFLNQEARLTEEPAGLGKDPQAGKQPETILKVKGHRVPVVWKQRKIYNGEEQVDCWFARNNAAELIDGVYKDYLAAHPFDSETSFGLGPSRAL